MPRNTLRNPLAIPALAAAILSLLLLIFGVSGTAGLTGSHPGLLLVLIAASISLLASPTAAIAAMIMGIAALVQIHKTIEAGAPRKGSGWSIAVTAVVMAAIPLALYAAVYVLGIVQQLT